MKNKGMIPVMIFLLLCLSNGLRAQVPDTLNSKGQGKEVKTGVTEDEPGNSMGNVNAKGKTQNQQGSKAGIKQVRSARPDMTQARGARPPMVMRQAGSGIPKGIGKPGGSKGPGGRGGR